MATLQERLVQALLGPKQQDDTLLPAPANPAAPHPALAQAVRAGATSIATLPQRVIQAAAGAPIGLRREDYTDDPTAPQPIDPLVAASTEAAGLMAGGSAPFAQQGALGIFGGRLAKTADQERLALAEALQKRGAGRDEIWNQTGWFRGVDGKWRFEIPDENLGVGRGYGADLMSGKINHPELMDAYPRMGEWGGMPHDVKVQRGNSMEGAYYLEPNRDLEYFYGHKEWLPTIIAEAPTTKKARNVVGHELQHAVQEIEGFAGGANPQMFRGPALNVGADWGEMERMMHEGYRRTAGEVEARNVQSRLDFTPEARRAAPPWTTQDVPNELQIVVGRGGDISEEAAENLRETLAEALTGVRRKRK